MTVHSDLAHLTREIGRYFRDAIVGITYDDEAETITANVITPEGSCHWVCEIASDDDWYTFINEHSSRIGAFSQHATAGDVITIPLMETQS